MAIKSSNTLTLLDIAFRSGLFISASTLGNQGNSDVTARHGTY